MEQIKVKAKKWGNSLGVVLPREVVIEEGIKEGNEIEITIQPKKAITVGDLIKIAKKHPIKKTKKSTQEIMDEIDFELYRIRK